MKKVLFVATVVQKHIKVFHIPFLQMFRQAGYETYVAAANDTDGAVSIPWCDRYVEIGFRRSPFHPANIGAFFRLRRLINSQHFDISHCHTPVGGVLGRLASAKARRRGAKVIYTAHGFHFYRGAPFLNWLLFYPVEKLCAPLTDLLITINRQDYELARRRLGAKRVEYVPGVGVDTDKFGKDASTKARIRAEKRRELGIPDDAKVILSVGELNANKNHETAIRAVSDMDVYYLIAGEGGLYHRLRGLIDGLQLEKRVRLLGYRSDIAELHAAADMYLLPSYREGLNLSVMEAMASGLPIACSRIRGNTDLTDPQGGVLFDPDSPQQCKAAIVQVLSGSPAGAGEYNRDKIASFSKEKVCGIMKELYGL